MKYRSIYIYDWNQLGMYKRILGYDKTFQVTSVADMVRDVLSYAGQNVRVDLTLGGDGARNYQSVGAGFVGDSTGDRSLQLDSKDNLKGAAALWLPRLTPIVYGVKLDGVKKNSYRLLAAVAQVFPCIPIHSDTAMAIYYGPGATSARLTRRRKTSVKIIPGVVPGGLKALDRK